MPYFGLVTLKVFLVFLWVAIAGVAGCGLRCGSEIQRGTNLRRDPRESRMDLQLRQD
jgi:hypothetical protein